VVRNPGIGGIVHRTAAIRHVVLRKFPYAIHYRIASPEHLFITGLYHGARDPKLWLEREDGKHST